MLVSANLSEDGVNASQIHGKLVKYPDEIFDYLFLCSIYHHMKALKEVTHLIHNICSQC